MFSNDLKKSFLFLFLAVAAIICADRGAGYLLDYFYRNSLVGETGGKVNAYMQLEERPYLTIAGNSRTLYSIVPDSLPFSSFNLSLHGMDLSYQAPLLHILHQNQKLGSLVLLSIEPGDFLYDKTDTYTTADAQFLKHYYGKDSLVTNYVNRISRFEEFKCQFKLYRFNGAFVSLVQYYLKTQFGGHESNGYVEQPTTPLDSLLTLRHARQLDTVKTGTNLSPATIGFLEEIVRICKRNNTQLICYTAPNFYTTEGKFTPAYEFLDRYLAAENIPYLDYSRIKIPGLKNPAFWKDAVHPNVLSARLITSDLVKRLRAEKLLPQ